MIDLDQLAEKRARDLKQKEDVWKKAVWSSEFQKLTQSMSDGEVERFLSLCPTVKHFELVVGILAKRSDESPFAVLNDEAKQSQTSVMDWIQKLV